MSESHSQSEREVRISVLMGDRLCASCAYNLTGQTIVREPHYKLLIVRCPECATVASVQEYPLLGRWAVRWAMVLAGIWFLVLVAMWIASGAIVFGFSLGTAEWAQGGYQREMWNAYSVQAQAAATSPASASFNVVDFQTWWSQSNPLPVFGTRQWFENVDWQCLYLWLPLALCAFALGCFWAVALLTLRRRSLLLWGGAVMLVAAGFSMMVFADWYDTSAYQMSWWRASQQIIGVPMVLVSLAFGWLALSLGLAFGRSTVRGLLRVMLPPRLRSSLATLWIIDDLEPPIGLRPHQRRQVAAAATGST